MTLSTVSESSSVHLSSRCGRVGCSIAPGPARVPAEAEGNPMRGWLSVVVGLLLVLLGAVWTLQGLNVLGGSAMSGHSMWAVIGPIVAVIGLLLLGFGVRNVRRPSSGA